MRPLILIVDDEGPLLRAMQRVLGKSFEVLAASHANEALAAYREGVRAVLTDYSMPDIDGLGLAKALRERGYRGPIAMLSAVTENEDVQRAVSSGAITELISKPWKSSELVARILALARTDAPIQSVPTGQTTPGTLAA